MAEKLYAIGDRDRRRLQALLSWYERVGRKLKPDVGRRRRIPRGGGGEVRVAVIKENPSDKDNIKINLLTREAVEQTEGDESDLDCYGLIANGTRLDMVIPRPSNGLKLFVRQIDIGDGLRWYFDFPFQGTKDYTI